MENKKLERLNRILNMIIRYNETLARVRDEEELITQVSGILQMGGFSARITYDDSPSITEYKTSLRFPLEVEGNFFGYFEVFTEEYFDEIERRVLENLANNIAYTISALRYRKDLEILEERYKSIFENAPVALMEEDFSSIKRFFDRLESEGVTDVERYLDEHPEEVLECLNNILIIDVNNTCIKLYNARSKADLIGPLSKVIRRESIEIGRKLILSLYRKGIEFEGENINYTLDGRPIIVYTKTFVLPGYENTLQKVIVSIVDITEERMLEDELRKTLDQTVEAFSKLVGLRDPYTEGHQSRVAKLACEIGKRLGLKEKQLKDLKIAGLLHDIGKLLIPGDILNKPGRLSDYEFAFVKVHPQTGYEILKEIEAFSGVADTVFQHHERLNGSGYPRGLKDGEITLPARIIAVADVVEAMLSHRPYRPALRLEDVIEELERGKGILYDPNVVSICEEILEEGFSF